MKPFCVQFPFAFMFDYEGHGKTEICSGSV